MHRSPSLPTVAETPRQLALATGRRRLVRRMVVVLLTIAVAAFGLTAVAAPARAIQDDLVAAGAFGWGAEGNMLGIGSSSAGTQLPLPVGEILGSSPASRMNHVVRLSEGATGGTNDPKPANCAINLEQVGLEGNRGRLYCWGPNTVGQVGDSETTGAGALYARPWPVAALNDKDVVDVATGPGTTCAIADDELYCWGKFPNGKIMPPTKLFADTGEAFYLKQVTAVSIGTSHTCAIASGDVYCWGSQYGGALGNGSSTVGRLNAPVRTSGYGALADLEGEITKISAGNRFACAIADNQLFCWGVSSSGQTGTGITDGNVLVPTAVDLPGAVTDISAGAAAAACAVADSKAYCWGIAIFGQLGNGSGWGAADPPASAVPVAVQSSAFHHGVVSDISVGFRHACAVSSGQVFCWGDNRNHQLGGAGSSTTVPVAVPTQPSEMNNLYVTEVSAGDGWTMAVGLKGPGPLSAPNVEMDRANSNGQLWTIKVSWPPNLDARHDIGDDGGSEVRCVGEDGMPITATREGNGDWISIDSRQFNSESPDYEDQLKCQVRLYRLNGLGNRVHGPWSLETQIVVGFTPSAPTDATAVLDESDSAEAMVLVSASAPQGEVPDGDGGRAITGYRAFCVSPGEDALPAEAVDPLPAIAVTGLTRGHEYTCGIAAINAVGEGQAALAPPINIPALEGSESPENPESPADPERPETPENPENPENPGSPADPEGPETPEGPENSEVPENPESPRSPASPPIEAPSSNSPGVLVPSWLAPVLGLHVVSQPARLRGSRPIPLAAANAATESGSRITVKVQGRAKLYSLSCLKGKKISKAKRSAGGFYCTKGNLVIILKQSAVKKVSAKKRALIIKWVAAGTATYAPYSVSRVYRLRP